MKSEATLTVVQLSLYEVSPASAWTSLIEAKCLKVPYVNDLLLISTKLEFNENIKEHIHTFELI